MYVPSALSIHMLLRRDVVIKRGEGRAPGVYPPQSHVTPAERRKAYLTKCVNSATVPAKVTKLPPGPRRLELEYDAVIPPDRAERDPVEYAEQAARSDDADVDADFGETPQAPERE